MKAQKRKIDEIESKKAVLVSNQTNIKTQIDAEQSRAANFERDGKPVPEVTLVTLEGLWGNLEKTEDQIRIITQELKAEQARYNTETNRYKQLKGLK